MRSFIVSVMNSRSRHRVHAFTLAGAYVFLSCCLPASGQMAQNDPSIHPVKASTDTDDTVAILEVGASTNWNFNGGAATFAPNLAAECTPIENWLELEAGVSPFYTRNSTEWDTDFLFKKPWGLSKKAEFMLGVGPQWAHLKRNGKRQIPSMESWPETSCSGQRQGIVLAGTWSQLTITVSLAVISSR